MKELAVKEGAPNFLSNENYLERWIKGYSSDRKGQKSAIEDFVHSLECRRALGKIDSIEMERLKSVRRAIDFRMRKCSNGRTMYYERYTPELLNVDKEDVETFVFDLQDKIVDATVKNGFTPPIVLVDVSTLTFAHLDLALLRNDTHHKLGYAWLSGTKFYVMGMSWPLLAFWQLLKGFFWPTLTSSVEFLPVEEMDKLLLELGPADIPSWCFEMSPQLRAAQHRIQVGDASAHRSLLAASSYRE